MKRDIHVIIPTYNRPGCISDMIQQSFRSYNGTLFCFSIYDSSPDNETQKLVKDFSESHQNYPLKYYHVDENVNLDLKIRNAINQVREGYFYVLGDGVLVDFNQLEDAFLEQSYYNYSIINIETQWRKKKNGDIGKASEVFYPLDQIEFVRRFFSHMTFFGATIVKTSLYFECQNKGLFEKYFKEGLVWWIAAVESELLFNEKQKQDKGMLSAYIYSKAIAFSKHKKEHGWTKGDKYYLYLFKLLNRTVELLPDVYGPWKLEIIRSVRQDTLATRKYLRHLRADGTITLKRNYAFRKDILFVPGWYGYMMMLCFVPVPLIRMGKAIKYGANGLLRHR